MWSLQFCLCIENADLALYKVGEV